MTTGTACVLMGATGTLGTMVHQHAINHFDHVVAVDILPCPDRDITVCDLADSKAVTRTIGALPIHAYSRWVLVVAAGVYDGKENADLNWSSISRSINVNLVGVAQAVCLFSQKLVAAQKMGRVVVVSSAAARVGSADIGYGVSKAGLEGLVRSCSKVYARFGVTFLAVAPGFFNSAMSATQGEARRNAAVAATHLKRPIAVDEVCAAVFLAVSAPDAMTGTVLSPNGGQI